MSNRPVGNWGRPICPRCGLTPVDTDHALHCIAHAAALQWLWAVARHLAPSEVIHCTVDVLLGGCAPCLSLAGSNGLAYVWEVLRVAFISVIYRLWVRAAICVQHENGQDVFYESRHVILSTVANVRLVLALDARRAATGVRYVQRDGIIRESDRFQLFFNASWQACGWSATTSSGRTPRFSVLYPVPVDLAGLQPINIPGPARSSQHGSTGFLF
jgi:hypothetical protein